MSPGGILSSYLILLLVRAASESSLSLSANPIHSLRSQLVERGYGQLQMVLARVFNLVVADPLQRLHKEHGGGNAGTGDLGRIVQWPGRQTMRTSGSLLNCLFAELYRSEERRVG